MFYDLRSEFDGYLFDKQGEMRYNYMYMQATWAGFLFFRFK